MTADDVVKKILDESTHGLTANREYMAKVVIWYAQQKCKEQRELCAIECGHPQGNEQVKLAPEPEFD